MGGGSNKNISGERGCVLASEPVGGRSRATELPCCLSLFRVVL